MSPDNLIALGIFGTAGLALIAGLGAWIWENTQKRSARLSEELTDSQIAPTPSINMLEPAQPITTLTQPGSIRSKFLERPRQILSPPPQKIGPAHKQIEEVELKTETVETDITYEEALQDQVEADEPSTELDEPEAPANTEDESFFTCSGHANWTSPENDRDSSAITRAIFRDGFSSLIFSFAGFSNHNWPREFLLKRETQTSYAGAKRHENISIHCNIRLKALEGKNLEFDGWWQADRHDNTKYLKYRFSGVLQTSRQIPPATLGPTPGAAIRPSAAPAPVGVADVRDISIPGRRFSIGIGEYRGNPFLEILENNRPWGETHRKAKRHFSFGRRKARMIILAKDQIQAFVTSGGESPAGLPVTVSSMPLLDGNVVIKKEDSFNIGSLRLPHPHIKITHKNESLGIGLSKADALLALWPLIEKWAKKD